MRKIILLYILLVFGINKMHSAVALIGSAISLNNKDLAVQLIAATNLGSGTVAYKKAIGAFGDISKEVEAAKRELRNTLGVAGGTGVAPTLPPSVTAKLEEEELKGTNKNKGVNALVELLTGKGTAGMAVLVALGKQTKADALAAKIQEVLQAA